MIIRIESKLSYIFFRYHN